MTLRDPESLKVDDLVTLKGQGHDPNMFDAHYLENGWR